MAKPKSFPAIRVVPYHPALLPAFQALNRAWISRYFHVEAEDERELEQAEEVVVNAGGQIFFALPQDAPLVPQQVLGCVGIYLRAPDCYEIIKLAVRDDAQGLGIGRRLMQEALDFVAAQGAERAVILSHNSLAPAMALYKAMGFSEAELGYKHLFERCNIELVCPLKPAGRD